MPIGTLAKITMPSASEVCRLTNAGGQNLTAPEGMAPAVFLEQLIAKAQLNDAVQFLAFALPKREAVWWACLCARSELREPAPAPILAALEAAEAWVFKPNEENRGTAMQKAQETKFDAPGAWAAMAAFWSGGSLVPSNLPAVPPAPHLTGVAVSGAVTLAAVQADPALADKKRERYIESALDIANGGSGRLKV